MTHKHQTGRLGLRLGFMAYGGIWKQPEPLNSRIGSACDASSRPSQSAQHPLLSLDGVA